MEDLNIKVCPFLEALLNIHYGLSAGMAALEQLHGTYGDEDSAFPADDFLETRDLLMKMDNYVVKDFLRIVNNRIAQARKTERQ